MKRWFVPVAALMLVVAACSGESSAQVASLEDAATIQVQSADSEDTTSVSEEDALLAFAACMRDNGVEDFEDPDVSADGEVQFNFRGGGDGSEIDRDAMRTAMEACRVHLEGVAFGPGGGDFDPTEMQDQLVAFAACMREEGVDMADPDLTGGGGGEGVRPFGDIDFDDPDVQAAFEVCQAEFGGEVRLPGSGGGPGGGADRPAPGSEG